MVASPNFDHGVYVGVGRFEVVKLVICVVVIFRGCSHCLSPVDFVSHVVEAVKDDIITVSAATGMKDGIIVVYVATGMKDDIITVNVATGMPSPPLRPPGIPL
jgi:hypothetical protein